MTKKQIAAIITGIVAVLTAFGGGKWIAEDCPELTCPDCNKVCEVVNDDSQR